MNKKEKKRVESFVRFLFNKNEELISIEITATHKKKKNTYAKNRIGSKVTGLSFRRQDFKEEVKHE